MTLSVDLSHSFGAFRLEAAFDAPAGVTALFGRSGSGKTSVVSAVAGLLHPDRGRVVCAGKTLLDTTRRIDLPPHRRRLGYVFQEGRLFPHLTVRQNLLYGRWFAGRADREEFARVVSLLGIEPLLARRPASLSGGEKQRVAIGRALLSRPGLLLMDEPLAALDDVRKAEILPYLERLRDQTEVPILYVSHDLDEVARLATTLVVLEDGKVLHQGPVAALLSDPAVAPALGLREAGAFLHAQVEGQEEDGLTRLATAAGSLWLPRIDAPVGMPLRIRISAQDVILSRHRPEGLSALNILPGTVTALRIGDGPGALVQVSLGGDPILVRLTRRSATALGLVDGCTVYAILKSVAVAQGDITAGSGAV